ncbi:MAG: hypothetical protein ABF651_01680 [Sporolactobacillus sp.]
MAEHKEKKHHKWLWTIIIVVIVLLVGGSGTGYYFYHQQQVVKEKARTALIKKENKFKQNIETTMSDIDSGYGDEKDIVEKYSDSWDTLVAQGFYDDPNYDDPTYGSLIQDQFTLFDQIKKDLKSDDTLSTLESIDSSIKDDMTTLNNSPKRFKDISSRISNLYGDYQTFYDMTSGPSDTDNLSRYKDKYNSISNKIETEINEINASIPNVPKK